jgi:hypothetical protein
MGGIKSSQSLSVNSKDYPLVRFPSSQATQVSLADFPEDYPVRARWTPGSMSINGSTFTWSDVSGNGYHASKTGTIASIVPGLRGLPAIQGTNSSDRRLLVTGGSTTLFQSMANMSLFAILQTPTTPENLHAPFGSSRYSGTDGEGFTTNMFNFELMSASYPCSTQMRHGTYGRKRFVAGTTFNGEADVITGNVTANQWCAYYLEYDGNYVRANLNGTWSTDYETSGNIIKPTNFYILGTDYGSGFYWGGKIHEIVMFSRVLTTVERAAIYNYVSKVYGLTL